MMRQLQYNPIKFENEMGSDHSEFSTVIKEESVETISKIDSTHSDGNKPIKFTPDGRLNTKDAATYVGLSPKTLANYRVNGLGPKYVKRGLVSYFKTDLDEWLSAGKSK